MARRTKKPAVKPELRREWLRRFEEEGQSPPQIAAADRYDVRTVRKQIESARQERERREARSVVLRGALEKHHADLCAFAHKLDSEIVGAGDRLSELRYDPMWLALREHLPRSPMWKDLDRWARLRGDIDELDKGLEKPLQELVRTKSPLEFPVPSGKVGFTEGVVSALAANVKDVAREQWALDQRTGFRLEAAGEGTTFVRLGAFSIGRVPDDRVVEIQDLVTGLLEEVTTWEQCSTMRRLFVELGRVKRALHEELLVVILRRVVPGRCRYCPL